MKKKFKIGDIIEDFGGFGRVVGFRNNCYVIKFSHYDAEVIYPLSWQGSMVLFRPSEWIDFQEKIAERIK